MKKSNNTRISLGERIALLEENSNEERRAKCAGSESILQTVNAAADVKLDQLYHHAPGRGFDRDPWTEMFETMEETLVISADAKTAGKHMNFAELGELLAINHKAFFDIPFPDPNYIALARMLDLAARNK